MLLEIQVLLKDRTDQEEEQYREASKEHTIPAEGRCHEGANLLHGVERKARNPFAERH